MTDFFQRFHGTVVQTNTKAVRQAGRQTDREAGGRCQSFKITLIYCRSFLSGTKCHIEDKETHYTHIFVQLKIASKM